MWVQVYRLLVGQLFGSRYVLASVAELNHPDANVMTAQHKAQMAGVTLLVAMLVRAGVGKGHGVTAADSCDR